MPMSEADPSDMPPEVRVPTSSDADMLTLVLDHLTTSLAERAPGEHRRMLVDELRGRIARGEYHVAPEAVAEAMLEERVPIIDWID